jgi:type III pantothenate kinase
MNLCIDFGNTNVKLSVYEGDFESFYYKQEELSINKVDEIFEDYPIVKTIVSSTRNLNDDLLRHLESKTNLIILSHETEVPIINLYDTPATLGKDRLAAVIGASVTFANTNCVVIDAGTCLTMDFIDYKKQYHGGNISPGIFMRRQAMHDFTDKLPLVDLDYPSSYIGKSTESALKNGILRGTIYEIESFIERIISDFGESKVLFTGGDTSFFEEHLKFTIFASPNLVLVGLNEILKFND